MIAPDFTLPDQNGYVHSLNDHPNSWRIVYFYPKDDTPGCTTEACNFRDNSKIFADKNIYVYGISKDSVDSHARFVQKYNLNFPLLSDPDHTIIEAYGSWKPKKLMGKEFLGIVRKTFLINPSGDIVKEYEDMDLKIHAEEILRDIEQLS